MAELQPPTSPIGPPSSGRPPERAANPGQTAAAGPSEVLEHCPLCGYSTQGLQVRQRCPECGTELDRRWIVFGGRHPSRAARRFGPSMRGVLAVLLMHTLMVVGAVAVLTGRWLLLAIPLVVFGLGWVALRPSRRFVAIGPEGLYIWRGSQRQWRYAWSELGRARRGMMRKAVVVEHRDQPVFLGQRDVFGSNPAEADRFVTTFNTYARPDSADNK